jgi:hypothetical protein
LRFTLIVGVFGQRKNALAQFRSSRVGSPHTAGIDMAAVRSAMAAMAA